MAAGRFTHSDDQPLAAVAGFNGLSWYSLGVPESVTTGHALCTYNETLIAAYDHAERGANQYLGRWTGLAWAPLDEGLASVAHSLAVVGDHLFTGGPFTWLGDGQQSWHIARWTDPVVDIQPDGNGDFPTIQDAVDEVAEGTIVRLGDGVFTGDRNRDIDPQGKNLIFRSASFDPDSCIID